MGKVSSNVFDLQGRKVGRISLPIIFKTPFRPDVIKRVVISLQSNRFQPQGRDVLAGKRTTAESYGTGHGIARIPRLRRTGRAAFAPGTVGGRATHPPDINKKIVKKIPKKEKRLALFSAIAATGLKERVEERGHAVDNVPDFPFIVNDDIQNIKKTKELKEALIKLGIWPDIYRVKQNVKIRAGKGKMRRGKKKRASIGPLIVISRNGGIVEAARNLQGVNVVHIKDLNAELLAPGTHPGRLTIWTESSIKELDIQIKKI